MKNKAFQRHQRQNLWFLQIIFQAIFFNSRHPPFLSELQNASRLVNICVSFSLNSSMAGIFYLIHIPGSKWILCKIFFNIVKKTLHWVSMLECRLSWKFTKVYLRWRVLFCHVWLQRGLCVWFCAFHSLLPPRSEISVVGQCMPSCDAHGWDLAPLYSMITISICKCFQVNFMDQSGTILFVVKTNNQR